MSEAIEGFEVPETDSYTIRPEEKKFTHEYTILKNHWPVSVISTNKYAYSFFSPWDWRAHFTVYDQEGFIIAHAVKNYGFTPRGVWNGSAWGWLRPHTLSDFDVDDGAGNHIGFIDGKIFDISKARFDLQNESGDVVAYAREELTQVVIRDSQTGAPLGFMKRIFDQGTKDSWALELKMDGNPIDTRTALIFAAFVVQNQSHFLADN